MDLLGSVVKVKGKGRKERLCPLGGPAFAALRACLKEGHDLWGKGGRDAPVFWNLRGGALSGRSIERMLKKYLIEAGLDAFNPVQISCRGMDPSILKTEFGERITFWGGGCDTQRILPMSTPDEVAKHVREVTSIFSPGGGFIFQQVHNILANVPPENVVAMMESIHGH